jgi:hypothetical protein
MYFMIYARRWCQQTNQQLLLGYSKQNWLNITFINNTPFSGISSVHTLSDIIGNTSHHMHEHTPGDKSTTWHEFLSTLDS